MDAVTTIRQWIDRIRGQPVAPASLEDVTWGYDEDAWIDDDTPSRQSRDDERGDIREDTL